MIKCLTISNIFKPLKTNLKEEVGHSDYFNKDINTAVYDNAVCVLLKNIITTGLPRHRENRKFGC